MGAFIEYFAQEDVQINLEQKTVHSNFDKGFLQSVRPDTSTGSAYGSSKGVPKRRFNKIWESRILVRCLKTLKEVVGILYPPQFNNYLPV